MCPCSAHGAGKWWLRLLYCRSNTGTGAFCKGCRTGTNLPTSPAPRLWDQNHRDCLSPTTSILWGGGPRGQPLPLHPHFSCWPPPPLADTFSSPVGAGQCPRAVSSPASAVAHGQRGPCVAGRPAVTSSGEHADRRARLKPPSPCWEKGSVGSAGRCTPRGSRSTARLPPSGEHPALGTRGPVGCRQPLPAGSRVPGEGWEARSVRWVVGAPGAGGSGCLQQGESPVSSAAIPHDGGDCSGWGRLCLCPQSPEQVTPLPPPSPWWQGAPGHTPVPAAAPMGAAASPQHGLVGMDDGWTRWS